MLARPKAVSGGKNTNLVRDMLLLLALSMCSFGAFLSGAPLVVFVSGLCLALYAVLFFGRVQTEVLFLPIFYQWTEVVLTPVSTIWLNVPLDELAERGSNLQVGALYALGGVTALAVGVSIPVRLASKYKPIANIRNEALVADFRVIAVVSLTLIALGYTFSIISGIIGSARELFNSLSQVKIVGLFILSYWCFFRRERFAFLGLVFGFEIAIGISGFFADFKNSLLTLFIAALVARPKFGKASVIPALLAGALLLFVAVFWSHVKADYRTLVNQGTGGQIVLAHHSERASFMFQELIQMDSEGLRQGFDKLVSRHGYIQYLSETLDYVPAFYPHENGGITSAVLRHITMPRIFYPSKPPLPSDTEQMAKYTGRAMLWNASSTSISLGHLAELYVDFGYFGGVLGMFMIGLLCGCVVRYICVSTKTADLVKVGLCVMVCLQIAYFGLAYVKLIGALLFCSGVAILFLNKGVKFMPAIAKLQATAVSPQARASLRPPESVTRS